MKSNAYWRKRIVAVLLFAMAISLIAYPSVVKNYEIDAINESDSNKIENFPKYEQTQQPAIESAATYYLYIGKCTIFDEMSGITFGNGNGMCDAGEIINVTVELYNSYSFSMPNVTISASSPNMGVKIVENNTVIVNFEPHSDSSEPISFIIALDCHLTPGSQIPLTLEVRSTYVNSSFHADLYVEGVFSSTNIWFSCTFLELNGNNDGIFNQYETWQPVISLYALDYEYHTLNIEFTPPFSYYEYEEAQPVITLKLIPSQISIFTNQIWQISQAQMDIAVDYHTYSLLSLDSYHQEIVIESLTLTFSVYTNSGQYLEFTVQIPYETYRYVHYTNWTPVILISVVFFVIFAVILLRKKQRPFSNRTHIYSTQILRPSNISGSFINDYNPKCEDSKKEPKQVHSPSKKYVCFNCGSNVEPYMNFCISCGNGLL